MHYIHVGLSRRSDVGFRLYGQTCLFIYSILQLIIKDSSLGPSCDWDHYLQLDFEDPSVTFIVGDDFLLGSPLRRVLQRCQISTPSKFLEITRKFFVSLCSSLLGNKVIKSDLLRGLSSFDCDVLLYSPSEVYLKSFDSLVDTFIPLGHVLFTDRGVLVSEYRSYVCHLRSIEFAIPSDPIRFFMSDWELMSRPHLYRLFKLCCCCCQLTPDFKTEVTFSFPEMGMRPIYMTSLLNCLQSSLPWLDEVFCLADFGGDLSHLRDLLSDQDSLYSSSEFSPWEHLRKLDRSAILKKLLHLARRFNPCPSSPTSVPCVTPSPPKAVASVGGKRGRVGSTNEVPASDEAASCSSTTRSRSQSPADVLSSRGVKVAKAPVGKIPRVSKE